MKPKSKRKGTLRKSTVSSKIEQERPLSVSANRKCLHGRTLAWGRKHREYLASLLIKSPKIKTCPDCKGKLWRGRKAWETQIATKNQNAIERWREKIQRLEASGKHSHWVARQEGDLAKFDGKISNIPTKAGPACKQYPGVFRGRKLVKAGCSDPSCIELTFTGNLMRTEHQIGGSSWADFDQGDE